MINGKICVDNKHKNCSIVFELQVSCYKNCQHSLIISTITKMRDGVCLCVCFGFPSWENYWTDFDDFLQNDCLST